MLMRKRIGIITHYHMSKNYGGNLQAYAMVSFLNKRGYEAEQISYFMDEPQAINVSFIARLKHKAHKIKQKIKGVFNEIEDKKHNILKRQAKASKDFNQNIPHSQAVYDDLSITNCIEDYDCFITGSDQVWNLDCYHSPYFLDFVPPTKIKLSYAASLAKDFLTESQKDIFRKSLSDYKAVSVREKNAEKLLKGILPVEIQTVVDPTLLLTREEWDEVCSDCMMEEKYVFCYFLGENREERKLAEQFARLHHLKVVAIPHIGGIKWMDRKFGDLRLYDVSPQQFISLIKHAEYVFTDSFHAVVFSNIYQKQYFVFNRNKKGAMASRIVDITQLFHQEERFCADKERETIEYLTSLSNIDYTKNNDDFERLKEQSISYLENNLKD